MSEVMSVIETEEKKQYSVTEVATLGVGKSASAISYEKQRKNGELSEAMDAYAGELIKSGESMRSITDSDDGCIDGREAVELLYINDLGQFYTVPIEDASEHERAKVAGGGYVTGLAMHRATTEFSGHVDEDISIVANNLSRAGIYCGCHTGPHLKHADDETGEKTVTNTDCGANDRIDEIFANGLLYREEIGQNVAALLDVAGISFDSNKFESVLSGWSKTLDQPSYFENSNGATRFSAIENSIKKAQDETGSYDKPVSVSKDLTGDHKEVYIAINYVAGETFSQATFRKMMTQEFPDVPVNSLPQVFVVDVARIVELAKGISGDDTDAFDTALYAGIAYQLATAATLTDGTLRTFTIS